MASDPESPPTSRADAQLSESLRRVLEQAPTAFALTRGSPHRLVYANAAFRRLPGTARPPQAGQRIGQVFTVPLAGRLLALLNQVSRDGSPLRNRFLGPLTPGNRPWMCTLWPLNADDPSEGVVLEMRASTQTEFALALQREVAERLLLSALQQGEAAEGAELSRQRDEFLADTGRQLHESLDTETTRKAVAGLSLPPLAAWCIVDLLDENDNMHRLTILHGDPGKQALVSRLDGRWTPEAGDPFGIPAVLHNARPVLIPGNIRDALGKAAHDAENLRVLGEVGIGQLLTVPLLAGDRILGAITFVSGTDERTYGDQDIALALALAARSAQALERARLYGGALALRDKAEAAALAATVFVSNVSHELRTPLNAIMGYVELISAGIHGPVTDEQRVDLERITSNYQHLIVIINELLEFLRVGSGRVRINPVEVPLQPAATQAIELLEALIAAKGLTCEVVTDGTVPAALADASSVQQILVNLLSNAVKFTNSGGSIKVVCTSELDAAILTVSDSGRGVPADKLELIFEPFMQADEDDARVYGGIGLGLAVSRALARAMHGDLVVESVLGEGSTFRLVLPRSGRRAL